VPETSIASICSVTRMDPSSAPEPMRPAQIKAVIIGPISHYRNTHHGWHPRHGAKLEKSRT
jgi:hypothetical protein